MIDSETVVNFPFGLLAFDPGLLFMEVLLFFSSLFLMLLVLVQRGKGGGLTGALGGMGGQSAFGAKAGDAFTKITVVTAVIWITLCMFTIAAYNPPPPPQTVDEQLQSQSGNVSGSEDGESESTPGDQAEDSTTLPASGEDATNEPSDSEEGFELKLDGPESTPAEETDGAAGDSGSNANGSDGDDKSPVESSSKSE